MTEITYTLLPIDQPSRSGRIYSEEVCEKIVEDFNNRDNLTHPIFGEMDPTNHVGIDVNRISHEITNVFIEGSNLMGTIKVLDTPCGNILDQMHDAIPHSLQGELGGYGMLRGVSVGSYTMSTISIGSVPILFSGKGEWLDEVMDDMEKSGLL